MTPTRPRLAACAGLLFLTGCTVSGGGPEDAATADPQFLRPGAGIVVEVEGHPDLSGRFTLDEDGGFAMPLIGRIDAYGSTPDDLAERLVAALADGYLRAPVVRVERAAARPVFITGDVAHPGSYAHRSDLTVEGAIRAAGGVIGGETAYDVTVTPAGRERDRRVVGLDDLLAPGDIVELRERAG